MVQVGGPVGFNPAGLFAGHVAPSAANPIVQTSPTRANVPHSSCVFGTTGGGTITIWDEAVTAGSALGWFPVVHRTVLLGSALDNQRRQI
jgi:hypothetical protein